MYNTTWRMNNINKSIRHIYVLWFKIYPLHVTIGIVDLDNSVVLFFGQFVVIWAVAQLTSLWMRSRVIWVRGLCMYGTNQCNEQTFKNFIMKFENWTSTPYSILYFFLRKIPSVLRMVNLNQLLNSFEYAAAIEYIDKTAPYPIFSKIFSSVNQIKPCLRCRSLL